MPGENEEILEEICKTAKMGLDATEIILPKIQQDSLKKQISAQQNGYKEIHRKAKAMLREEGYLPEQEKIGKKVMLRGSIRTNTLFDRTPSHVAEMMINGTTMGIINITKKLNRLDYADAGAKALAEDCLDRMKQDIEDLKGFLG